MLYDKRWDKTETRADPLTMVSFVAWLEMMPSDAEYDYEDCKGRCLYGLYMSHHGVEWWQSGGCSTHDSGIERAEFCARVYAEVACAHPWTFGAALARAKAVLAVQS